MPGMRKFCNRKDRRKEMELKDRLVTKDRWESWDKEGKNRAVN